MTATDCANELRALLDEALTDGGRLMTLLDEERHAMASADNDAMERVTGAKNTCLASLEALEQRRRALLDEQGLTVDPADMAGVARGLDGTGALGEQWEALRALMRQCQAANSVNGHVLRLRRQHVTRALAVLRGETPDEPLYGPGGEPSDNGDPPLLGEA